MEKNLSIEHSGAERDESFNVTHPMEVLATFTLSPDMASKKNSKVNFDMEGIP